VIARFDQVRLSCKVTIGGREQELSQVVAAAAYDDPEARKLIEKQFRRELMEKILEDWTPVIRVVR
jgi:hypothetical protein